MVLIFSSLKLDNFVDLYILCKRIRIQFKIPQTANLHDAPCHIPIIDHVKRRGINPKKYNGN